MSNLSFDIDDDTLAALLVLANQQNTSLTELVNRQLVNFINNHDQELLNETTEVHDAKPAIDSSDPQAVVEAQAKEDHKKGCCGDPDPVDATVLPSAPLAVEEHGDLESDSIMNRPIGEKRPPQGAPLYNKRVTNKWL